MAQRQTTAKRQGSDTALPRGVDDPNLRELLDHLGRLIANEYVALLRKSGPALADPSKDMKR